MTVIVDMGELSKKSSKSYTEPWQVSIPDLSDRWLYLLRNDLFCDVLFKIGTSEESVFAHKILLVLHSPVFETMLSSRWAGVDTITADDGKSHHVLHLPEEDATNFKLFLEILYGGKIAKNDIHIEKKLALLQLSKKYLCHDVTKRCVQLLKASFEETNAVLVYETAIACDEKELEKASEDFILSNATALVRLNEFSKFTKEANLQYFLEHDDLNVDELDLFNSVYNWGLEQHKKIVTELKASGGHPEKVPEMELPLILQGVLKCIRFGQMTPEQFSVEVVPKKVLSLQDTVDIFQFLTLPPEKREKETAAKPELMLSSEKKRVRKMFSYLFQRLKGHGYDFGRKWQNFCFQVDHEIKLVSLGFFKSVQKSCPITIGLKIKDYAMEKTFSELEETVSPEEGTSEYIAHVKFQPPLKILKDTWYTISYIVRGGETYYKTEGPSKITLDCGVDRKVNFQFKDAKYDNDMDQVPEICFRLDS